MYSEHIITYVRVQINVAEVIDKDAIGIFEAIYGIRVVAIRATDATGFFFISLNAQTHRAISMSIAGIITFNLACVLPETKSCNGSKRRGMFSAIRIIRLAANATAMSRSSILCSARKRMPKPSMTSAQERMRTPFIIGELKSEYERK